MQDTSFKIRYTRYKIAPVPADDIMVNAWTVMWLHGADLHHTMIELIWLSAICTGRWYYSIGAVPYCHQSEQARILKSKLRELHRHEKIIMSGQLQCYCCWDIETGFWFSHDAVALTLKIYVKWLNSLTVQNHLIIFSTPDTSHMTVPYRENWHDFAWLYWRVTVQKA
jgi:hypothetical protein